MDVEDQNTANPSQSTPTDQLIQLDSTQAKKIRAKIELNMSSIAALYNCSYEALLETHNESTGVDLTEQVQLVLTDPPYNVLSAKHDRLPDTEMPQVVETIAQLLRPGGHVVLFCTAQQWSKWATLFTEYDPRTSGAPRPFFNVDKVPMIFTNHPSFNKTSPHRKSCSLNSAGEFAVHAKRNGLPFKEEEKMVNYINFGYVQSSFPAYRNVIDNIRAPEPGEIIKSKSSKFLRTEQKPIALLKELISRFSQPRDFVVDLFGGTFSTTRASFSLTDHRYFIGSEMHPTCFNKAKKKTVEDFAQVIHTNASSFTSSIQALHPDLKLSCKALLDHLASALPRRPPPPIFDCWIAPENLPLYQNLPRKTLSAIATFTRNYSFIDQLHVLPENWPRSLWYAFNQIDPRVLLLAEASSCSLAVAPSTIKHPNAGLGVFATKPFNEGDYICNYYGTLVYHALPDTTDTRKEYGVGNFKVDLFRYQNYAIQVSVRGTQFDKVRNINERGKHIFIVPTEFNVGSYINEWFYLEGDLEKNKFDKKKLDKPRRENVRFIQTPTFCDRTKQIVHPGVVRVMANTDINRGDELFANYRRVGSETIP